MIVAWTTRWGHAFTMDYTELTKELSTVQCKSMSLLVVISNGTDSRRCCLVRWHGIQAAVFYHDTSSVQVMQQGSIDSNHSVVYSWSVSPVVFSQSFYTEKFHQTLWLYVVIFLNYSCKVACTIINIPQNRYAHNKYN